MHFLSYNWGGGGLSFCKALEKRGGGGGDMGGCVYFKRKILTSVIQEVPLEVD